MQTWVIDATGIRRVLLYYLFDIGNLGGIRDRTSIFLSRLDLSVPQSGTLTHSLHSLESSLGSDPGHLSVLHILIRAQTEASSLLHLNR